MSDDILDAIDASIARNRVRFDPLGPDWDEGSVEGFFDTMRVRLARAGIEEGSTPAEAVPPVPWVQSDTSPLVSFADVAAGPSNGGDPATVDVRRRAQDGNDPVTAAMRDVVLRQGLRECAIDGVRQVYRDGAWHLEVGASPVDASSDTAPDVPRTRSKLSDLAAALRARARRGGPRERP